ncbi:MAG: HAD-IA family hydrolase [Bacteroidia bacterium]|nr:HAD-IA family hydrolase [Bacteroidia bacterium]
MVVKTWSDIDLNGIKGILWDLDNTLYLYDSVHQIAFKACKDKALLMYGLNEETFNSCWKMARNKVHDDLHGQGASHSRLLYLQKLFEFAFGNTNPEFAIDLEEIYWSVFLKEMKWRSGAKQLMHDAKSKGIEMAIVTDLTTHIQLRKFIKLGLNEFVRFLVSSEEAGVEKPHPNIFRLALEKLNLKAQDVIMIGDNFEKDIKGAEAIGIKAYWIDDKTK